MDDQYLIELNGERRDDGTVFIVSPDLPLFSVIGHNEQAAIDHAMKVLPEYLKANVPDFVELRELHHAQRALGILTEKAASPLPAHVIATITKARDHAARRP